MKRSQVGLVAMRPSRRLLLATLMVGIVLAASLRMLQMKKRHWALPVVTSIDLLQSPWGDRFLGADLTISEWTPSGGQEIRQRFIEVLGAFAPRVGDRRRKLCLLWWISSDGIARYQLEGYCSFWLGASSDALWIHPTGGERRVWSRDGFRVSPTTDAAPEARSSMQGWTREGLRVYDDPVVVSLPELAAELEVSRPNLLALSILLRKADGTVRLLDIDEYWIRVSPETLSRLLDGEIDGRREATNYLAMTEEQLKR